MAAHPRLRQDPLVVASLAYLAANLIHGADHIRQHMAGLNTEIKLFGGLLTLAAAVVAFLALRRHPKAAMTATIVGLVSAALVLASHVLPHWGVLSDSYVDDIHPDAASWVVVLLEIATGIALGVVGVYQQVRRTAPHEAVRQS